MKNTYLFSLIAMLAGCSQVNKNAVIVVDFDIISSPKYSIIEIVPLQTNDSCLVDKNFRLQLSRDYYFVGDMKKIIVFNKTGSIRSMINPIGKGGQEVFSTNYFLVNDYEVEIFDGMRARSSSYDIDGKFIKSNTLCRQNGEYVRLNNFQIFDNQSEPKAGGNNILMVYDRSANILLDTLSARARGINYGAGSKFQFDGQRLYYLPSFYNTIFEIQPDATVMPAYTFDFGDKWMAEKECYNNADHGNVFALWKIIAENGQIGFLKFMKNGEWIVLSFELKNGTYRLFYNETSGKQFLFQATEDAVLGNTIAGDGEYFYSLIDAITYINQFGEETEVSETDNPVIVKYRIN